MRRRQKLAALRLARAKQAEDAIEKTYRDWSEDDISFRQIVGDVVSAWQKGTPATARQLYAVWYQCGIQHTPERFQPDIPEQVRSVEQLRAWASRQNRELHESREAFRQQGREGARGKGSGGEGSGRTQPSEHHRMENAAAEAEGEGAPAEPLYNL